MHKLGSSAEASRDRLNGDATWTIRVVCDVVCLFWFHFLCLLLVVFCAHVKLALELNARFDLGDGLRER
jgi:hypothetical protein